MEDAGSETLSQAVARRLRGLLAEQRISASAVAREIGISQASMSRRTTGLAPLTLDELSQIAAVLGIPEQRLLTGERGDAIRQYVYPRLVKDVA